MTIYSLGITSGCWGRGALLLQADLRVGGDVLGTTDIAASGPVVHVICALQIIPGLFCSGIVLLLHSERLVALFSCSF